LIMKNGQRNLLLLISSLLVLGLLFGCSSDSDRGRLLAKVGDDKIYEDQVNEIVERMKKNFNNFDDELNFRRDILDSLIIQRMLVQEAYKKNIDELEEVNRLVLANKDKFLLDILYIREIEDKAKASDKEIKDWYDKMEYKYKVSHILVKDLDTAQRILDSLRNGGNFEELAVTYSTDPSAQRNRGELDYFVWGQMVPEFQEQVIKMKPGEISEPFKTRYGYHIVKMIDRVPNTERRSLENARDDIVSAIKNNKKSQLMEAFSDTLRARIPIKIDTGTVQYLMHKRENLYPPQVLNNLPRNDYDLNQLDRNDKELVLASWDGGQVTVGEYFTQIQKAKAYAEPPSITSYDSLAEYIFQLNVMDLLASEARRRGLENDPEFQRKLEGFKELAMADIMKNDSLQLPNPPDDGEIRQYYEDHLDDFREPPSIDAYEIMVPTKAEALKYKRQIRTLEKFKEVASRKTERSGKRQDGGHLGYIRESSWGRYYRAADSTPVGGISNPIDVANGNYSIIYVQDKRGESVKQFNTVRAQIANKLEQERRQEVFSKWVEDKKKEIDVEIYENSLRATIDKDKYEETQDNAQG